MDISVCILIALIVLYGISRQVEVARRSQYHVVHKSSEQRVEIEKERERADWLLRNILPEHVIEPLRQFVFMVHILVIIHVLVFFLHH